MGQVIPCLRQQLFPLCIMMLRQLPLGGISLVATSALFFLQYWLSHDISLCRELVSICLKFNEHRAYHSLSTFRSSASNKTISHSNSYMYSIHFSQNLYRGRNASLFPVTPSCELHGVVPELSLLSFPRIFAQALCNIYGKDLITLKLLLDY